MRTTKVTIGFFCFMMIFVLAGCLSNSAQNKRISRNLYAKGIKNQNELYAFFLAHNPEADKKMVREIAALYVSEAKMEGINSDCAFVQMCLETGFLCFGGLVTPDMHNYCGLGAINAEQPGERFETMQLGVRAHIQHLHAYATPESVKLNNECIDNRYKYVLPRGKAPNITDLTGTWASDSQYDQKLERLLMELENL